MYVVLLRDFLVQGRERVVSCTIIFLVGFSPYARVYWKRDRRLRCGVTGGRGSWGRGEEGREKIQKEDRGKNFTLHRPYSHVEDALLTNNLVAVESDEER